MWIVKLALRRPYTLVVMALLILLLGITSIKERVTMWQVFNFTISKGVPKNTALARWRLAAAALYRASDAAKFTTGPRWSSMEASSPDQSILIKQK
ncbi:MAG: hypothetical protein ACREIW_11295 [Chthoniobacterales bacterium]